MSHKTTIQAERRRRGRAIRKQRREERAMTASTRRVIDILDSCRDAALLFVEACALTARAVQQALTTPVNGGRSPAAAPAGH